MVLKSHQPLCKVFSDCLVELGGIMLLLIVASSEKCRVFTIKLFLCCINVIIKQVEKSGYEIVRYWFIFLN